jgi:signal transduction histidine kinase
MNYQQLKQQLAASKIVFEVENRERTLIAGKLHESLAQNLSVLKMNLSALEWAIPRDQLDQKIVLSNLMELVDVSCKELRYLSQMLMPQTLLRTGLVAALNEYIHLMEQSGIKISFYAEDMSGIAGLVEVFLYKALKEIVENAVRHSGANSLDIALINDRDGLSATIEDNGAGFEANGYSNPGQGLISIKSRIAFLNGTVEWNSSKGKGTLVAIHVPKI